MTLQGQAIRRSALDPSDIQQMLTLMNRYYNNVSEAAFLADLAEKQWVILLRDRGEICGFSTQQVFSHTMDGKTYRIIYSGDTIIAKAHWGSFCLPVTWYQWTRQVEAEHPGEMLFWLLTSKGYMTYRFLPVFFKTFYPRFDRPTPIFEQRLIHSLAGQKFPERKIYGEPPVLAAENRGQCLKPNVDNVTLAAKRDSHVAYFNRVNPHHDRGDELVCIAQCNRPNILPFIIKRIEGRRL